MALYDHNFEEEITPDGNNAAAGTLELDLQWALPAFVPQEGRIKRFLNGSPKRKHMYMTAALLFGCSMSPWALQWADTQLGGAIFRSIVNEAREDIINDYWNLPEEMNLEEKLEWLSNEVNEEIDMIGLVRTDSLRLGIAIQMIENSLSENPYDISAAKDAAIQAQAQYAAQFVGVFHLRSRIARESEIGISDEEIARFAGNGLVEDMASSINGLDVMEENDITVNANDIEDYFVRHPEHLEHFDADLRGALELVLPRLAPAPEPVATEWRAVGPIIIEGVDGYGETYRERPLNNICTAEQVAFDFYNEPESIMGRSQRVLRHASFQAWCEQARAYEDNLTIGVTFEDAALPVMPAPGAHFDLNEYLFDEGEDITMPLPEPSVPQAPVRAVPDVSEFRERASEVREDVAERVEEASPSTWNYLTCTPRLWNGRADYGRCVLGN